jgi:hypothetical protein
MIHRLVSLESAQAKGTKMLLNSRWTVVNVPVVGAVHTGAAAAYAVNQAYRAGKFVSGGHAMPLWPGDTVPAHYDRSTRLLSIRWRNGSAFVGLVVSALAGIGTRLLLSALGVEGGTAAAAALAAALAVGAGFVAAYVAQWVFGTVGGQTASKTAVWLVAAAVAVPVFLLLMAPNQGSG